MATFTEKDKTSIFVGTASTAKTTGDISTLTNGEIGIFNKSKTTRLTEATAVAGGTFTMVQGKGTEAPFTSDAIVGDSVVKVTRAVAAAATEKVDYIGYNTSSGSIQAINDNLYIARLHIDQSITANQGGIFVKHGQYQSDASATQVEIANGLLVSFINNFSREAEKFIKFERVTSSTVTASTSGTITVVNGSKFVTAATDIDNGGAVVGDYLSLGGVAYKIVAINVGGAQVAELDIPYQGTSATIADASCGFITAANALLGNWGIKLTGVALKWSLGKFNYRKANWVTTLQSFGTTTVTQSVGANPGKGTYEQAAELEWFYKGNDGEYFRMGEPNIFNMPKNVVAGVTYDSIIISTVESGGNTTQNKRQKDYMFLIPNSTPAWADSGTADDITDVLEIILAGKPVYGGAVSASGAPLAAGDLAI
jgi:hypothetical protein